MLEHILFAVMGISWLGLSGYLIYLSHRIEKSHAAIIDAMDAYAAAARSELLKSSQLHQHLISNVVDSYNKVNQEFSSLTNQIETISLNAISQMGDSARSITNSAAVTCQQILHSSFPEERLNWNWHTENSFMCYYCHYRFPLTELEQHGQYKYCREHGTARRKCS